jgi:RimJ/RimL family protein N-acetyltransferase
LHVIFKHTKKSINKSIIIKSVESILIQTERFLLKTLAGKDVSDRYLGWLNNKEVRSFITAAKKTSTLLSLREYVRTQSARQDTVFLGIFAKENSLHIGNIKYQPVDSQKGYAVMGILIGDPAYRGLGVASEAIKESAIWLKNHRNINQIVLGVHKKNEAAVRAYRKAGFQIASTPHIPMCADNVATMVWNI